MVIESLKCFTSLIQLRMTKHPSRKVMNFGHLLGCDTIGLHKVEYGITKRAVGKQLLLFLQNST